MSISKILISTLTLMLLHTPVQAALVHYNAIDLGSDSWRYDYSITNDSVTDDIHRISIIFELGLYENLISPTAPDGWGTVTANPGNFVGASNGFFDVILLSGLAPGESAGLFSVEFNWLDAPSIPGIQPFEILDPGTFALLGSGFTTLAPVPLPAAAWLFGSGLIALVTFTRRRKVKTWP